MRYDLESVQEILLRKDINSTHESLISENYSIIDDNFPIKNEDELVRFESKLLDKSFRTNLVCMIHVIHV